MDKYEEMTSSSVFTPPVPERDTSDEDTAVEYDDSLGGASPLAMPTTEVTDMPNLRPEGVFPFTIPAGSVSVFNPVGSNDESQHVEPSAAPEFDFSRPPVVGDAEVEATAPEDDGQEGAPPGDDEPPVPGDEASNGDNGGRNGRSRVRKAMPWVIIIAAILALAAFVIYQVASDDQTPSPQEVATDVADRVQSVCQTGEYPESLAEVGVLRYGDSLSYNDIQPFWDSESVFQGDADDIFGNIVTQLYDTVGDGCTPAGVAYWRYLLPHVIDADRVGVDNHDARVRINSYMEETDTRIAVAEETARQFANCRDMQYVNLTVEDAPRIFVAAYTADYNDVVFVQTPLLQVDALANGQNGLIVVHCQFGKSEGVNDSYVNEAFISPTLRAIVYRDQPTGGTVFILDPDDDTQEASEEAGARDEESAASVDQEANESTESDVQATPETPASQIVEDANQTRDETPEPEPQPEPEPEPQLQPEPDPQPEPQPQPEINQDAAGQSSVGEVQEEPTGPLPTEPEQDVPAITENPQPTEQQSTEDQQDADTDQPEPQPQPEAQQPEPQPEPESTTGGSGEGCGGSCGNTEEGSGDQGDDTGGDTGTVDTGDQGADGCPNGDCSGDDGGNDGDDCPNGDCPGDDGGNDGDDCPNGDCPGNGGDDNGDDCPNGDCPGNGDDDGDDEDDGGGPEPACLPGEILDPFGNCKAPDPGPAGF